MSLALREIISTASAPQAAESAPIEIEQPKKPLPPESLAAFGISYSLINSADATNDAVLDRVLGSEYDAHFGRTKPMSLRDLRDKMGIAFTIVSSTEPDTRKRGSPITADASVSGGPNFS